MGADGFLAALQQAGDAAGGHAAAHQTQHLFLAVAERGDAASLAFPQAGGVQRHPRMQDELFQRHLQLEANGVGRIAPMDAEQRRQVFHLLLGRVVEDQQGQLPLARNAVRALITTGAAPALFRRAEHDLDVIQRLQRQRRELRVPAVAFVQGVQIVLQQQTQPLLVEVIAVEQREANIWHG